MAIHKPGTRRKPTLGCALIVEDDALLAMELEDALTDGGASRVVVCHSVAAAMAELENLQPDILILDVHLADRDDGWAIAELVTEMSPDPPVIIFATGTPELIPDRIARLGAVIGKPYRPEALVATLGEHRRRPGLLARLRDALGSER